MSVESISISLIEFHKTRDFKSFEVKFLQSKQDFEDLFAIALNLTDHQKSFVASWICNKLVENHADFFYQKQTEMIDYLERSQNQSSLRSFMKILTYLEIDSELQGKLIDLCVQFLSDSSCKVALQMYSMQVLIPLCKYFPDLLPEITQLLDLHSVDKTPAYHASVKHFKRNTKK